MTDAAIPESRECEVTRREFDALQKDCRYSYTLMVRIDERQSHMKDTIEKMATLLEKQTDRLIAQKGASD